MKKNNWIIGGKEKKVGEDDEVWFFKKNLFEWRGM